MDDTTILGGVLNQLGQTAKQTVKQVAKLPAASAEGSGEPKEEKKQQWQSDEERVKFLKDLYGSDKNANPNPPATSDVAPAGGKPTEFEEQKKLLELRNQLHKENYYAPTFNRKNPPAGGEERPAEKVENEKKQEMIDLQKKEDKKPPPLAAQRAAQRVENLPGAG